MPNPGLGNCFQPGTNSSQETTLDNCQSVWGPDARWEQTGHTPADTSTTTFCAVKTILARALGENILMLGSTYQLTYAFRDKILSKSLIGRQMLEHYYKNAEKIYSLVIGDPILLAKSIIAWYNTWPFVMAMLALVTEDSPDILKKSKIRFSKKTYVLLKGLIKDFQSQSDDSELKEILKTLQNEVSKFVGKSPKNALELLVNENYGQKSS